MARSLASASTQYLRHAGTTLSNEPLTLAAWAYPLQSNAGNVIVSLCNEGTASGRFALTFGSTAKVNASKQQDDGTVNNSATTVNSYTANQWNHAVAVFASDTSRTSYCNGDTANKGTSTTAVTDPTPDNAVIGAFYHNAGGATYLNGYVAHAAVWTAALSDADVLKLYNSGIGADPRSVRPDALVAYWPLLNNDGDQDYWGNFHLTASGSPTYAKHPPVLMRSRPKYVILGSAAPSIATIEIAGTRQVGNTLTCNATSSPSGATFTYQWYMADDIAGTNQTAISGATSQTYELSYANIGAATKLYEGLDANAEAFIACGATPTKDAVTGDETVSSYVSITEAAATAPVGSPFESAYIR